MIFVNEQYSDFNYLVSTHDNYVVLTNVRSAYGTWQDPQYIDVIYQYFYPSIYTIETTQSITSEKTFDKIDTTSNIENRADFNFILSSYFIILFFVIFLLNAFTRFARKGGIFFGS